MQAVTVFEASVTLGDGEEAATQLGDGRVLWERDGNRFVVTFVPEDPRVEPFADTFELVDGEGEDTMGDLCVDRRRSGDEVFVRVWHSTAAAR